MLALASSGEAGPVNILCTGQSNEASGAVGGDQSFNANVEVWNIPNGAWEPWDVSVAPKQWSNTDYNLDKMNYDRSIDPSRNAETILKKAASKSGQQLNQDHIAEHRAMFERVSLDLGGSNRDTGREFPQRGVFARSVGVLVG